MRNSSTSSLGATACSTPVVNAILAQQGSDFYHLQYAITSLTGVMLAGMAKRNELDNIYNVMDVESGYPMMMRGFANEGWIDRNVAIKHGTVYDVVIDDDVAETGAELKTIKIGEKELTINPDMTITGELPWSYTAKDVTEVDKATFMEFSMSDYAALFDEDDRVYFSKGDWNGDGVEDAIGKPDNATISDYANRKLLFKRNADGTVTVYVYAGSTINATEHSINNLVVKGENRLNTPSNDADMSATTYTFKLTYAQPSNETVISNFKLGNYTGSVEGQNITVNVPYGTDVTGLIATFDKSIGATIRVNDRVGGVELVSGVTSVNYTNPVKLYVTSESKNNTVEYTVTVEQGAHFTDIERGTIGSTTT